MTSPFFFPLCLGTAIGLGARLAVAASVISTLERTSRPARRWPSSWWVDRLSRRVGLLLTHACDLQESVKTRHAQLLYESKLYKILQGGGG